MVPRASHDLREVVCAAWSRDPLFPLREPTWGGDFAGDVMRPSRTLAEAQVRALQREPALCEPLVAVAARLVLQPGEVRSIRFRPTFATHRAYTCDEVGQPMSALKLLGELGHGSVKMLEERYFKAARLVTRTSHSPGFKLL